MSEDKTRIGVSACLVGEKVRYDGGHKLDPYVTGELAARFELVPVCPEAEVGMGTPRETVRLEGEVAAPRMIAPGSGADWTARMNDFAQRRLRELAGLDLCGFVFKKNSPSCGVFGVEVRRDDGRVNHDGRGLFAAAITRANPRLPVEEEGRLADPALREEFVQRILAYAAGRDV